MTYLKIHFSKKKLLLRIKLNWFLVQITSLAKKLHFKRGKFFLYTCLFLAKNLSNFVFPSQKLPTDTAIISTHSNLPNKSAANLINFSEKLYFNAFIVHIIVIKKQCYIITLIYLSEMMYGWPNLALSLCQNKWNIFFSNFVAFSQCLNFNTYPPFFVFFPFLVFHFPTYTFIIYLAGQSTRVERVQKEPKLFHCTVVECQA